MNEPITALIAEALPNLTHPGTGSGPILLPIPALRSTANLPPEVAEEFAAEAGLPSSDMPRLVAEAIVALIEDQHEIVPRSQLDTLRRSATPVEPLRQVDVHCHCGARLFGVQIKDGDTNSPKVNGAALIAAVKSLSPECSLGHRPL